MVITKNQLRSKIMSEVNFMKQHNDRIYLIKNNRNIIAGTWCEIKENYLPFGSHIIDEILNELIPQGQCHFTYEGDSYHLSNNQELMRYYTTVFNNDVEIFADYFRNIGFVRLS
jgi:hypothetical protein